MYKRRPPRGWSRETVGVLGLRRERLQIYYSKFLPDCKPQFCRGGGDSPMITWGLVLIGICTLTSGLFRLVDKIEGRR